MNPDIQCIRSGLFWKTITTGINVIFGFFTSIIFARFLGKDGYGNLVLVYTIVTLFVLFSNFGLDAALRRFIPLYLDRKLEDKGIRFVAISSVLGLTFTFIFSIAMFLLAPYISGSIFNREELTPYMRWGVLYLFSYSLFTNIVSSIYCGFQRWRSECALNGLCLLASFFGISVLLAIFKKGVIEILALNAVVYIVFAIAGMLYIGRYFKGLDVRFCFEEFVSQTIETLTFTTPVLMSGILFYVITQFDKIILGRFRPPSEVAQYYIAFALGTGALMLIKVSEVVLTPYLAKFTDAEPALVKTKFQTLFRLFLHIPIMLCLGSLFFIEPFIRFIYGTNFDLAANILKLYLVVIILRCLMTPIGLFLLNVYGKTFEITKLTTINTVLHLLFYLLLIPRFGSAGALTGIIISNLIVSAYAILFLKETKKIIPYKSLLSVALGLLAVSAVYAAGRFCHIHSRLYFAAAMPLIYLLTVLLKGDMPLKELKGMM